MASITKQGFLFVLAGLSWASIASAEMGRQPAIPLSVPFIQNQGQIADDQVLFYARTFGGTVYVTADGQLVYALPKSDDGRQTTDAGPQSKIPQMAVIRETLVDADLAALPAGAERSGAMINSFIGNDPCRWQANIPSFTGVQFGDIYEGISLEIRATGDNVEKIFTVAPGADPARIALRLAGADGLSITPSGELEARTALGPVRFTAPAAYQRGAAGERQSVSVAYALEGDQVGFCVGAFDAARSLVIDPLLASTFIGGTSNNVIRAMALDSQSNVLVAGYTASIDFPTTNAYDASYNGGSCDAFIAKFDPQLTRLLSATYLGGAGEDAIMAMAINTNNGTVYVAGYTASTNFPMRNALYGAYGGGAYDGFVTVLNGNLSALTSSTYLGGKNVDMAYALALSAGPTPSVFVAGLTASTNFPIANTFGVSYQTNLACSTNIPVITNDVFVARFNTDLSINLASTYLGGTNDDGAYGLALDTNGFVYLTGYTASSDFPVTNGYDQVYSGSRDAFVARLPITLTTLDVSTFLGGTSTDAANAIAVAPFANIVCVAGYTYSANFPRSPVDNVMAPGYTNRFRGGKDAFLTRLDLLLTNILASTYLGGTGDDEATAVLTYANSITNSSLRIYVAGWTTSSNFPVTTNAYDTNANGGRDAFVSYFGTGDTLQASTYLGGATNDSAYAMALQPLQADFYYNALFVAGATASTNFPATLRSYDSDRTGQTNDYGFVTKLGAGLAYGTLKWQVVFRDPGDSSAVAGSPSLGWDGSVYCGFGSNLYAFDAQGRQRWRVKAAGKLVSDTFGDVYGLGSIPAVSTNGTIYVTTDLPGALQAISPTGGVMWTFSADTKSHYSSPAIGSDGTIYFGSFLGTFYAVSNGISLWTKTLGTTIFSSPAIASNGSIFVANASIPGNLRSFRPDGSVSNSWQIPGPTYSSPTFGTNGRVYIGSGSKLLAFDPGNAATQRTWTAAGQIYAAPTIGSNGMIYVGGGANFYAFSPDGTTNFTWVLGGLVKSSATMDTDGNVIVGAGSPGGTYYLYSFNPVNGATNWALALDDEIHYHSPLIQRDGTIYMTDQFNIYSVFGRAATGRTNWPTARHDVLRTGNAAFDAARFLKPTGLTVTKGSYSDRVLVNWNGNANAEYYKLFRNSSNDIATAQALGGQILTTNYVDIYDSSMKGLIYYYWVQVLTPVAASDFSDPDTGGVPPDPPTGVVASKGNPTNAIVIAWDASANATTYALYQSQTNATNTAALLAITTNVTAYTNEFPNIIRGLTYYYWVMAGNGAAGTSGFSAGDGVTNSGGTPPLAPAGIMATTNSSHAVYVTWSASDYAAMYAVYRSESTNIPAGFMAVTAVTNFADTTAASLRNYYYWVRATNQYGLSEFSAMAQGWRLLVPPENVRASKGEYLNKVRVSWDLQSAATSYIIWRNSTNDPSTATNLYEAVLTATNYDDLVIARGAGYYYWVQSRNVYGYSEFGVPDIGGTVPYPPLNVNATDGTDNNPVIVTWDAVPGGYATGYQVFRQDEYTPWLLTTTPLGSASGTAYSDPVARPGQRYYYWVKSTNQFGPSDLSGFDTGYRPLTPPYAISASDGLYSDHLYVTWSISDNASVYELWRGTNSDRAEARMLVNAVPTNFYDDTDSVQGVLYYYWVKAKTPQFVSDFSPYDSGYRALRPVDLGVSDLVFLPTRMAVGGAPAAVSFRVTNYGMQNMAEPNAWVACNFYISSNSVFGDADDKWMGGTNLSIPLAVGDSTVVVLPKAGREVSPVPTEIVPGWYYIFVNIRHAAPTKWIDPNPGNNTISRNGGVIKIITNQPAGLQLVNDFNGDGYTDMAMYRESTGTWQIWLFGTQGFTVAGYGGPGFKAVPYDYDGDGKTDLAVYQEATGTWKIWFSSGNYALASVGGWGGPGFKPVPCDYDGDGRADPAVYQESTGTWQVWFSANRYATEAVPGLGGPGWQPVAGDFDGDAKADPTIYQESTGTWMIWQSSWQYAPVAVAGLGGPGYRPVAADYDLDGIMDPSVFQANTGSWWAWLSASGYAAADASVWGNAGTVAVPGDYDGDGLADPAVYWESFGMWRLWLSSTGYQSMEILAWPGDGFRPVWP